MSHEDELEIDRAKLPRIPPMVYEDVEPAARQVSSETKGGRDPRAAELVGITMWNPALNAVRSPFVNYIKDSTCLPVRDREIAILRTAWRCGADFMWEIHTEIGLQCGLTQSEIDRVGTGKNDPAWTTTEVAVMEAMDQLHDLSRIADPTWQALADVYDHAQLLELITLAGSYHVMAYLMGAVGIRPPSGSSPDLPGNRFLFSR